MNSETIRKAIKYAHLSLKNVAESMGQSQYAFNNKMARGGIGAKSDKELEKIAQALGAKYYCFFEFPDGTKIGDFPQND
ncbi:MAG: hypothetical protein K2H85_08020 [Allobaculum sp.]|nr:hypothetical protein [Allobaculum sp.]